MKGIEQEFVTALRREGVGTHQALAIIVKYKELVLKEIKADEKNRLMDELFIRDIKGMLSDYEYHSGYVDLYLENKYGEKDE